MAAIRHFHCMELWLLSIDRRFSHFTSKAFLILGELGKVPRLRSPCHLILTNQLLWPSSQLCPFVRHFRILIVWLWQTYLRITRQSKRHGGMCPVILSPRSTSYACPHRFKHPSRIRTMTAALASRIPFTGGRRWITMFHVGGKLCGNRRYGPNGHPAHRFSHIFITSVSNRNE